MKKVKYIPIELVPDTPMKRYRIVEVRCKDMEGRQFLVEMQMIWSDEFMQRVLFNASKAYVRQLDKNENYELLQPVYSLNLVNDVFAPDLKDYYHYYDIVNVAHTDKVVEDLHLVFVELPKFKAHSLSEKKMQVLWLRFLTEVGSVRKVPEEFLDNPEVKKAVDILEESSYSEAQLEGYDYFWDMVRTVRTYYHSAWKHGYEEGLAEGRAEVEAEDRAEGVLEGKLDVARNLKDAGMELGEITKYAGLSLEELVGI